MNSSNIWRWAAEESPGSSGKAVPAFRVWNLLAQKSLPTCLFVMALVKRSILDTHLFKTKLPTSSNAAKDKVFFLCSWKCWFLTHARCQCSLLLWTCCRPSTETLMVIVMFLVMKSNDRSIQSATLKHRAAQFCYSSLTQVSIKFREILEKQQCTNLEVIFFLAAAAIWYFIYAWKHVGKYFLCV